MVANIPRTPLCSQSCQARVHVSGRFPSGRALFCGLPHVSSGRWLAAPLDAGSLSRPGIGFVFAPPDRSILIQPSEVTRFASIANWLCLAPFSVPGPPRRERPDTSVPSARCCCLLRSYPSSPRTRHPPASAIRHLASSHPPLATLPAAPAGHALSSFRVCRSHSRQSGSPDPAWAKLLLRQEGSSPTGNHGTTPPYG